MPNTNRLTTTYANSEIEKDDQTIRKTTIELNEEDKGVSGSDLNDVVLTMNDVYSYCEGKGQDSGYTDKEQSDKRRPYTRHDKEINFGREAKRIAETAQRPENTTRCIQFNFELATKGGHRERTSELSVNKAPKSTSMWDDLTPRRMVSFDNVDILYHFPRFIKEAGTTMISNRLVEFGRSQKLSVGAGADSKQRNKASAFRKTKGAVFGCCILTRVWHGIGHSHEDGVISTAFLQSARGYGKSMSLLNDLRFLSVRVNSALQKIDVKQYDALATLVRMAEEKYPHVKAMAVLDPLLMEGRAIQYNRQTPLHADRQDPDNGWAFIVVLGKVTSGTMYFPRLNHRVRYISGDAVVVRGKLLQHEVEAWEGDQRISIAHFTHAALWREFGMECP